MAKIAGRIRVDLVSPDRWEDFRLLKLEALKEEPQAFGADYEEETKILPEKWQERLATAAEGKTIQLFALDKNKLVGMIGAYFEEGVKFKHIAKISGLYVKGEYRGQGIGRQLMEAVLAAIRKQPGILKAKITANPGQVAAVSLYKSLGFEEAGTAKKDLRVGEKFFDLVKLELFF
jgi:ribosomal protein S18 acetylase RimI-like enzyme